MKITSPFLYIHSESDTYRVRVPGLPSRSFSVKKCGSPRSAIESAIKYRNFVIKKENQK
jgi:hypothetical protein